MEGVENTKTVLLFWSTFLLFSRCRVCSDGGAVARILFLGVKKDDCESSQSRVLYKCVPWTKSWSSRKPKILFHLLPQKKDATGYYGGRFLSTGPPSPLAAAAAAVAGARLAQMRRASQRRGMKWQLLMDDALRMLAEVQKRPKPRVAYAAAAAAAVAGGGCAYQQRRCQATASAPKAAASPTATHLVSLCGRRRQRSRALGWSARPSRSCCGRRSRREPARCWGFAGVGGGCGDAGIP